MASATIQRHRRIESEHWRQPGGSAGLFLCHASATLRGSLRRFRTRFSRTPPLCTAPGCSTGHGQQHDNGDDCADVVKGWGYDKATIAILLNAYLVAYEIHAMAACRRFIAATEAHDDLGLLLACADDEPSSEIFIMQVQRYTILTAGVGRRRFEDRCAIAHLHKLIRAGALTGIEYRAENLIPVIRFVLRMTSRSDTEADQHQCSGRESRNFH